MSRRRVDFSCSVAVLRKINSAAIGPPSQSRYCGLRVLLLIVMMATVDRTTRPIATGLGRGLRKARAFSAMIRISPATVARLLSSSSAETPGPKISQAWNLE